MAAAASFRFAFERIGQEFEKAHPDVRLAVTFGSSGSLMAQIADRAPFDVFFSADADLPRRLVEQGLAQKDDEFLFARGRLVVWTPTGSRLDVQGLGLGALVDPAARKIAIANPKLAPFGRAAEAALRKAGIFAQVQDRLVFGEDVGQAAQFVESGAADVGIIALALARAPAMQGKGNAWLVPDGYYAPLEQRAAVLATARDKAAAAQLREFVTSDAAREILKRFGLQ